MAVKKISELTVEELTKELKKRGLDINGDRDALLIRLRKVLLGEKKPQATAPPGAGGSSTSGQIQKTPAAASSAINKPTTVDQSGSENQASAAIGSAALTDTQSSHNEGKEGQAAVEGSTAPTALGKEMGTEGQNKEEGQTKKVTDDPPLDLMADESQNDFDDDIVCVSVTPGRGILKSSAEMSGHVGQKQEQRKDSGSVEKTTTASASTSDGASAAKQVEKDASKTNLSLWVSGLTSSSRAADLKSFFSTCAKVTGAKVVASAKSPGSKCFGIVTVASSEDVEKCIKELNGTSLKGKTVTVEVYTGQRSVSEKSSPTPNLWISGIGASTKAADLKKLFLTHGKVIASTIVTSAVGGGFKRFGLVKMSTCEEAETCIQKVNKTDLGGRVITVERAKSNALQPGKASPKSSNPAPPLMTQKTSPRRPSTSKAPALLSSGSASRGSESSHLKSIRPREDSRARRGFGRDSRRVAKRVSPLMVSDRMRYERERHLMRMRDEEMKAKQAADLVHALALERDRRKQKEEADRLAYERERLEIEKMKLERERIEAERLRVQLEQERRQNEREQLERERNRNQMYRNEQRLGPNAKRSMEHDEPYWDYLVKKPRESNSPISSSMQNIGQGHRESIPGQSSGLMVNRSSMSSMYRPTSVDNSNDSGPKSEWKSLYNMASSGGDVNGGGESQWKSLSSSVGSMNDHRFPSASSSFRDRPFPGDNPGTRMKSQFNTGGFKGFGGGRGGHKWR